MKRIAYFICFVSSFATVTSFTCPFDGYFSHESDCSQFYSCLGGVSHLMECPPGLHFNGVTQTCDWPEIAGCSNGVSKIYNLINPPNSSINMVVSGGQKLDSKATNMNFFGGVTLNWQNTFVSPTTIFAGILLPGFSHSYSDTIFGTVPVTYKYSASTSSDAANVRFVFDTTI